ncbi:hypothetical protein HDU97_001401 [Phlyctochytrium planicorne]|nr:hypothetical protein HDU97_001401 [Phlyctochytrium planicorne]
MLLALPVELIKAILLLSEELIVANYIECSLLGIPIRQEDLTGIFDGHGINAFPVSVDLTAKYVFPRISLDLKSAPLYLFAWMAKYRPECFRWFKHDLVFKLISARRIDAIGLALPVLMEQAYDESVGLLDHAAGTGQADVVRLLYVNGLGTPSEEAMNLAAQHGHFDVVKYLHEIGAPCSENIMDLACTSGNLEVVKFLRTEALAGPGIYSLQTASERGFLDIARFLVEEFPGHPFNIYFNDCIEREDREMLQVLYNAYPGYIQRAAAPAAQMGKKDMLKFIWEECPNTPWNGSMTMISGSRSRDVDIVRFLLDVVGLPFNKYCFYEPLAWESDEIVDLLLSRCSVGDLVDALQGALSFSSIEGVKRVHKKVESSRLKVSLGLAFPSFGFSENVEVMSFILEHFPDRSLSEDMERAAGAGKLDAIKILHDFSQSRVSFSCNSARAMDAAASHGHLDIVRFLHEHRTDGCSSAAADGAAMNGHLEMIKFLAEHYLHLITAATLVKAIDAEDGPHGPIVDFLIENGFASVVSPKAVFVAALKGCSAIVDVLISHNNSPETLQAGLDGALSGGNLDIFHSVEAKWKPSAEWVQTQALALALQSGELDAVEFVCRKYPLARLDRQRYAIFLGTGLVSMLVEYIVDEGRLDSL